MLEAPVNVAHALCVYAEPLAARRRVVVVGDSSLGLDARLVALGARAVHVYDPDPLRARENAPSAARGVVVRELPPGEFDVREGAFDLAIVPDLATIEDRAGLLVRVRRLVGPEGAALVAAKSVPAGGGSGEERADGAPGLDYYEMYDLVALQFASVRMIGQVPFRGVALAELGEVDEEPAVSVDTQLIEENDAPEVYIALAAQHEVRLEPYAIVQLPSPSEARAVPESRGSIGPSGADLAAATLRAEVAEAQLEEQRSLVTRLTGEAERSTRHGELEASLHDRTNKLKEAETRAGDHYVRAERLSHDLRRLEEELERQRDRAARLTKELDDEKKARTRAEVDLGLLRKNPDLAQARERSALLEEALRAAEEAVNVLQQRADEAEKLIAHREAQIARLTREIEAVRVELGSIPRVDPEVLAALAARAEQAEARAALLDAELAEHEGAQAADLATLETLLRERAQTIAGLEQELVRRERMVRELVGALEEVGGTEALAPAPGASHAASEALDGMRLELERARHENGGLRAKLDSLALEVARREGELQARSWRIAELEERLASVEARPDPVATAAPSEPMAPSLAQAELNALRQALAQEHEARVALESGEELSRARADIARQAALLEQLAGELEARDRARLEGQSPPGQAPGAAQS
jgi:chromosome segregation ATPase